MSPCPSPAGRRSVRRLLLLALAPALLALPACGGAAVGALVGAGVGAAIGSGLDGCDYGCGGYYDPYTYKIGPETAGPGEAETRF